MSALTASPFHPLTGFLLPVYREAYLVGDLAPEPAEAVTQYLRQQPAEAELATARWQEMQASGEIAGAAAPPWEAPKKTVAPSPAGIRRFRLPKLRLFALLGGLALTGATGYGLNLAHQQEQADAAGPVAQRTEHLMEDTSIRKAEAMMMTKSQ